MKKIFLIIFIQIIEKTEIKTKGKNDAQSFSLTKICALTDGMNYDEDNSHIYLNMLR